VFVPRPRLSGGFSVNFQYWCIFSLIETIYWNFSATISTTEFWVKWNNGNTGIIKFWGEVKSLHAVYQSVFLRVASLMPRTVEEDWQWSLLVMTSVVFQWELWKETSRAERQNRLHKLIHDTVDWRRLFLKTELRNGFREEDSAIRPDVHSRDEGCQCFSTSSILIQPKEDAKYKAHFFNFFFNWWQQAWHLTRTGIKDCSVSV